MYKFPKCPFLSLLVDIVENIEILAGSYIVYNCLSII